MQFWAKWDQKVKCKIKWSEKATAHRRVLPSLLLLCSLSLVSNCCLPVHICTFVKQTTNKLICLLTYIISLSSLDMQQLYNRAGQILGLLHGYAYTFRSLWEIELRGWWWNHAVFREAATLRNTHSLYKLSLIYEIVFIGNILRTFTTKLEENWAKSKSAAAHVLGGRSALSLGTAPTLTWEVLDWGQVWCVAFTSWSHIVGGQPCDFCQ